MRLDCGKLMEKGWREKGDLVMRLGRKNVDLIKLYLLRLKDPIRGFLGLNRLRGINKSPKIF
jgi:hypothetical protein